MKTLRPSFSPYRLPGVVLLTLLTATAQASSAIAPAHILNEVSQARLAGEGSYRWFGLKIYDAQLWVGEKGYAVHAPSDEKFVLNLRYARDLYGKKIAEASRDEMQKLGLGSAQQREQWLARMEKLFPDVKDGTHLSGVYLPDEGARFYLDGTLLGDIRDAAFARAFFAIWLDANSSAQSLRLALLVNAVKPID